MWVEKSKLKIPFTRQLLYEPILYIIYFRAGGLKLPGQQTPFPHQIAFTLGCQ